ncbi:hypothetical protein [Dapis sp. BLCC M172]|uniref:hypothetical protein n=1 Tax=Dapis sp. BLCC M172 TaxID=2975281 RepID=UPI003CF89A6C
MEPLIFYIVIYSRNLVELDKFYSKIGFNVEKHKHGDGDEHLVCKSRDVLLEIYPLPDSGSQNPTKNIKIGLKVPSHATILNQTEFFRQYLYKLPEETQWGPKMSLIDPDGNIIDLFEYAQINTTKPLLAPMA